ncbi:MAG: PEGA domain-containing protein [Patescibacteria group bacterium]|jgi:hypothetical protein
MTTIFSLYASGYKISLRNILTGQLPVQKTGILVVDSLPKGADISLNRQFRGLFFDSEIFKNKKLKTPSKIKGLLPGDYILSLDLDGYWPWQQKVSIYPGISSYVENIVLFKRNLPVIFLESLIQNISLDPSGQKIILEEEKSLVDLNTGQKIDLGGSVEKINFLDSKRIILDDYLLFDYSKNKYIDLFDGQTNISRVKLKGDYLFYLQAGLKSINLFNQKNDEIFSLPDLIDYDFYNGYYFLLTENNNGVFLKIYSYRQKEFIREFSLPSGGDYEIISQGSSSSFVYIYDKKFKNIYIANTLSKFNNFWAVINNVNGFSFVNRNNFVYFSDFEIYAFDVSLSESFLISRFDNKIKNLIWHPKNYIIYSNDKDIAILDLQHDGNSFNLVTLDEISNMVLDKMGSIIYFTGKINDQTGLYKLFIR